MEKRVAASVRWECLEPFLNRVKSRHAIYSVNEFQQLVRYERDRSDRQRSAFSVAVFEVGPNKGNGNGRFGTQIPETVVAGFRKAVRATDHVGWYGCQDIGVILPGTTEDEAMICTAQIQRRIEGRLKPACVRVYSYQDGYLKRRVQRSGDGKGNGNGKLSPSEKIKGLDPFCPLDRGKTWSPSEPLEDLFARKMPRWKRLLDVTVAVAAILVFAPVFLVVGVYIKLVSPGPIIFKQKRVGYRAKLFDFYKFRTMKQGNDQGFHGRHAEDFIKNGDVPMTKLDEKDSRIIRGGKILRRAAIDELPQLFNVLKGDMSLVGPRPCIVYEAEKYLRWHTHRFDIVPGITGLWQVNGKNDLSFRQMICLDISYCRNMSLLLDLRLLAATIPTIASGLRKAVKRKLRRT